jgi:arabinan endo-1,5-alpha-L-arabinosidase
MSSSKLTQARPPRDLVRAAAVCGAVVIGCSGTGSATGVGGSGTGGASSGGSSTGGTATGGDAVGSTGTGTGATGGTATGGEATGGTGTGGDATGGTTTGGTATGGTATGGTSTGGTATGGTGTGGDATGGTGTAGTPDDLCDVGVWDGSTPEVLALSGSTYSHDPTMVEHDGVFYRFWTGNNIPSATSTDLTNWRDAPAVFRGGYSSWVNEWLSGIPGQQFNYPWAPDASYFGGQYHIYSTFSAIFGDNISCITHLTTSDPGSGDWTDHGPVICTEGNENYNAIDADAGVDENGTPYLAFGSSWDGIMAFQLNPDGSRAGTELTHLAGGAMIEAPVLFRRCGYYYLFVSFGRCCQGANSTYNVRVGRSEDIMGPYTDRDGTAMLDGGGTLMVQGDGVNFAAAGHSDVIVAGDMIYHLYHAYRQSNGAATFRIVEMPFDEEGWPVPGGP